MLCSTSAQDFSFDTDRDLLKDSAWQPENGWYLPCKVVGEFLVALALLVVTGPVVLIMAALVRLTSKGPAFYCQTRLGRLGRPYTIYKLRTMVHDCEVHSGPRWSLPRDPRVTGLGRFLRRTHLDELPQLWNILRGDMSLVGPRPERPEFVPELGRAIPHYCERLLVRPGVTGLAQVQLPADTDLPSVRRKLAYDLYYVRGVSPWLDLRIVLCTGFLVLGVPYHILRALFLMPSGVRVERAFRSTSRAALLVPQIQPAV